jgi:putative peptidoglycan lipid II flippase
MTQQPGLFFSQKYKTLAGNVALALSSFVLGYLLLRVAPAKDYGNFAFVLILQGLAFGLVNALLASPLLIRLHQQALNAVQLSGFTQCAIVLALVTAAMQGTLLAVQQYELILILVYAAAGFVQLLRWYGRCYCQNHSPSLVVISDVLFSMLCIGSALGAWWLGLLNLLSAGWILLSSAVIACGPFVATLGQGFWQRADFSAVLQGYARQGKPALVGVVTVEATANIHSYLVVLVAGGAAFAPLAAAALFLRPMSVIQASLGQSEKPLLAKALTEPAGAGLAKIPLLMRAFRRLALIAFTLNSLLVLAVYFCWPVLLWPDELSRSDFLAALLFMLLIMLLRSIRGPTSALLQAADQYRQLSLVTVGSSAITVPLVLCLLWVTGPVSTLIGILCGELLMTIKIESIYRKLLQQWVNGAS